MKSRNLLAGYILVLFGTLPIAWPLWTSFLRDRIGGVISIEEFHLIEYGVLGILGTQYLFPKSGDTIPISLPFCQPGIRYCVPGFLIFAVGLAEELLQGLLPQRFFQWSDVRLNWAGTAGGLALGRLAQGTARWLAGWGARCRTR